MHEESEMSMMGELNFLLDLQVKQMEDKIVFNQSKYVKKMLKKFGLEDSKPTKTPMLTKIKLTKDDEADSVDSSKYQESVKRIFSVGNKMHKAFPLPGESSHWQYKFPLPVEGVPTTKRMEIPLPGVCTAMMKKLPVKDRWQLH
nr:retrovirus-related Pol polyprotein from transposon TNT 1-94 [Tanacetum cinerariifolium]